MNREYFILKVEVDTFANLHIFFYLGNTLALESDNQGRITTSNPAAHGKSKSLFDYSESQKMNADNINLFISKMVSSNEEKLSKNHTLLVEF